MLNCICLLSGCGQDAQGADERAGHLSRAVRPDAEAARHHRVGMIARDASRHITSRHDVPRHVFYIFFY